MLAATLPAGFQMQKVLSLPTNTAITSLTFAKDGRYFYSELKPGKVWVVKNGVKLATPLIALQAPAGQKLGIQCVTLDPNFATNGFFYLYSSREPGDGSAINRVSRYRVDPNNKDRVLAGSEVVLLDNMKSDKNIHNGGAMHFGADGLLYIATGEGSDWSQSTSKGYAQDLTKLKLL